MSTALMLLTPLPTGALGTGLRGATPAPSNPTPRAYTLEAGGQISPNGKWEGGGEFLNGKWLDHWTLAWPSVEAWLGVEHVPSSQAEDVKKKGFC